MSDLTYEELLEVRRVMARSNNKERFSISGTGQTDKQYAQGRDKNGLDKEQRAKIEEIKGNQAHYDDEDYLTEVWE